MKSKYDGLEIAIIGISGKFPKSKDHRQFWDNLKNGEEMISHFTDEELAEYGMSAEEINDPSLVKAEGMMNDKGFFDPGFFGYSIDEAMLMDPQIRLFHEHCWKALEDAGYVTAIKDTKIGLFAGASVNDNWKMHVFEKAGNFSVDPFYLNMIRSQNFMSTLISYKLNLRGPAVYVDSACSTSLTAIHLACRSLLTRDCKIALAGGVSVKTSKSKGHYYEDGMILSSDGYCRAFDAKATGAIIGEGVGVVVLKRLSEAIKDKDHIYSIIRSTAVNNDGSSKVGFTAPSVKGQSECIMAAHKIAGIDPKTIDYVETHGTGTRLGDPIEIRALNLAFKGEKAKTCAIGSVKTNIGHLDVAAGIAGIIKTSLSIENKLIPPSLHFTKPNPEVDFDGGPFYVNTELKKWEKETPLRAGVSAFGIGGTNVHVVLEEAPDKEKISDPKKDKLILLSAKTESALERLRLNLLEHLQTNTEEDLADVSYTLQTGRKSFAYRLKLLCEKREDAIEVLSNTESRKVQYYKINGEQHPVVFMFSGLGSQYPEMSKGLYENEPLFKEQMDICFDLIRKVSGMDIKAILYPQDKSQDPSAVHDIEIAQYIVFATEYALAKLLIHWGLKPHSMIGYSFGEYVAACVSGVFSLESGIRILNKRGALVKGLPKGVMLSVPLKREDVESYLNKDISLAIDNNHSCVLSGTEESITIIEESLKNQRIMSMRLDATRAIHSYMMDPILREFEDYMKTITLNPVEIPYISNVTGDWIKNSDVTDPIYWTKHLRNTVEFSKGIEILLKEKKAVYIEIGPSSDISAIVNRELADRDIKEKAVNVVPPPLNTTSDEKYLLNKIGQLWLYGVEIDWKGYYNGEERYKVSLPTYSFEEKVFPTEVLPFQDFNFSTIDSTAGQELKDWMYFPIWKSAFPTLIQHTTEHRKQLFFSQGNEFTDQLKELYSRQSIEVIEVLIGDTYVKRNNGQYVINPMNENNIKELFSDLEKLDGAITDIVYTWSMEVEETRIKLEAENTEVHLSYFTLVNIAKHAVQLNNGIDLRVAVITDALHSVLGTERIPYAQSMTLGVLNVLSQEYPVSCINIDLDFSEKLSESTLDQCFNELIGNTKNRIVALRSGKLWIQDFETQSAPSLSNDSAIKSKGVYIVTGGLGKLGSLFAKHLIDTYDVKVVIIGRKSKEQITSNTNWIELNKISSNVHYYSVELSTLAQVQSSVEDIEKNIGQINGVLHCAGIVDNEFIEPIENVSFEKAFGMFTPKVEGIINLYEVFKDKKLDFLWASSSIASILGGLGFSSYSSANLFMDYFILSKAKELPRWICVNLAEMHYDQELADQEIDSNRRALKPKEIIQLLEVSLRLRNCPSVIETVSNLHSRIEKTYEKRTDFFKEGEESEASTVRKAERPILSNDYVAAVSDTEIKIKEIFEAFLGIEGIGIEDDFIELGGDSLKAMVILRRIGKEFNVEVLLKEFLTTKTIEGIAKTIDEKLWLNSTSDKKYTAVI